MYIYAQLSLSTVDGVTGCKLFLGSNEPQRLGLGTGPRGSLVGFQHLCRVPVGSHSPRPPPCLLPRVLHWCLRDSGFYLIDLSSHIGRGFEVPDRCCEHWWLGSSTLGGEAGSIQA